MTAYLTHDQHEPSTVSIVIVLIFVINLLGVHVFGELEFWWVPCSALCHTKLLRLIVVV